MTPGCGAHAGLGSELRAAALATLDRIGPALDRVTAGEPATDPTTCASCPLCAVLAVLRGERPELAMRLAEQASALVTVLRAVLDDTEETSEPAAPTRRVQRIPVERC